MTINQDPKAGRDYSAPKNDAAQAPTTGTQARYSQSPNNGDYTTNAGAIPRELKALPQWLCWKREQRDGKPTKPPYDAKTGKRGKSNDPATWGSFEVAVAALQNGADYAGIGFAFHVGDGLCGLDLDHVIDLVNSAVDPRALAILERFKGTYCEVSPSKTGFRIFCQGRPGRTGKNADRVKWLEVYDHTSPRYLTVTGNHWKGTATTVTEQQAALDWLHAEYFTKATTRKTTAPELLDVGPLNLGDAALLDKAMAASNGAQFRALWQGDLSRHGNDHSTADLALCSLLAFWTGGDFNRIDRLFRQSGLMRDKWEREDYRQRTIDKAIAGCHEVYTGESSRPKGNGPASSQAHTHPKNPARSGATEPGNGPDTERTPHQTAEGEPAATGNQVAGVVAGLAQLPPLQYDRIREARAKEMGVRVATLDKVVAQARGERQPRSTTGTALTLESPEPWPEAVDGAALLSNLSDALVRFIVMPEGGTVAVVLWIVYTYCHEVFYVSPILGITSPERRCGKTTLQTLLTALTHRPLPTSNISPAAVFRCIERWQPTLLIDEADTFIKDNEELRGVINSGHTRATAFVIRVEGDPPEPQRFSTWAPKAIALIGTLPGTLHDRAIGIGMRRKLPGEQVETLREDRLNFGDLCRQCQRWAQDHLAKLKVSDPNIPPGLNDRAADNWRPLLAIADLAGGDWPKLARAAVKHLASGDDDHEEARVKLLGDIRSIFADRHVDRITSAELVEVLIAMEDRPWPEWKNSKPLTQNQLARLLRPFKIKPAVHRIGDKTPSGYLLEQFKDTFTRYLPPFQTSTPQQPSSDADSGDFQTSTQNPDVEDQKTPDAYSPVDCWGVEVQNPPDRARGVDAAEFPVLEPPPGPANDPTYLAALLNESPTQTAAARWWFVLQDGSRVSQRFTEPVPLSIAEATGRKRYGAAFSHAEPQEVQP